MEWVSLEVKKRAVDEAELAVQRNQANVRERQRTQMLNKVTHPPLFRPSRTPIRTRRTA